MHGPVVALQTHCGDGVDDINVSDPGLEPRCRTVVLIRGEEQNRAAPVAISAVG